MQRLPRRFTKPTACPLNLAIHAQPWTALGSPDVGWLDYVQPLPIEEAKQHLETPDDRIEEIGLAVGYPTSFRTLIQREA